MTERKMRVGGVQVYQDLAMISILGTPHGPGMAGVILETLGAGGINAEFISCCPDSGGGDNIVVCVHRSKLTDALDALGPAQARLSPVGMATTEGLVGLAVFGPHFREIPAVAGHIFRALADAGINIVAISTSVSSVTSVFDATMLEPALASLHRRFDIG